MARKKCTVEPSIFRFMCIKDENKNYHSDFKSLEEAIKYIEKLKDSKIEWYGLYEIDPKKDHLVSISHKRLIPHNDIITYVAPEREQPKVRRKRVSRKK